MRFRKKIKGKLTYIHICGKCETIIKSETKIQIREIRINNGEGQSQIVNELCHECYKPLRGY